MKPKLLLYNSPVKSPLLYASIMWHPDKGDIQLFEGVQRRATKYILNDYVSDYKSRLTTLKLLLLVTLRKLKIFASTTSVCMATSILKLIASYHYTT